jgi:hypothetical protein
MVWNLVAASAVTEAVSQRSCQTIALDLLKSVAMYAIVAWPRLPQQFTPEARRRGAMTWNFILMVGGNWAFLGRWFLAIQHNMTGQRSLYLHDHQAVPNTRALAIDRERKVLRYNDPESYLDREGKCIIFTLICTQLTQSCE